ncbi:unnamed protein product [Rangifer tarandus platyrhynchus]|uniref:Uncharacterized protein n=1 Tax=Rangifer tarandus platyrhynchus TaxID=3082113 RepID=A0ABN8XZW8_RANTA|nr:unnamed protein product [Rangifer tarandus platyrhynchus]
MVSGSCEAGAARQGLDQGVQVRASSQEPEEGERLVCPADPARVALSHEQDDVSPVRQRYAVVDLLDTSEERTAASGDPGMWSFDDMEGWTPGTCDHDKTFRAGQGLITLLGMAGSIFPTEGPGLLHCRQALYCRNHQGRPSATPHTDLGGGGVLCHPERDGELQTLRPLASSPVALWQIDPWENKGPNADLPESKV